VNLPTLYSSGRSGKRDRRVSHSVPFFFGVGANFWGIEILGEGYGMPSSHAQFMAFFAVYVTLYLIHRFPHSKRGIKSNVRTAKDSIWIRLLESIIVLAGASTVAYSRIYLQYHTFLQVVAGMGIGAVLGASWYGTVLALRASGVVDWILHLRIAELLWFKDGDIGSLEHDLREEWIEWRKSHDEMHHKHENKSMKTKKGH